MKVFIMNRDCHELKKICRRILNWLEKQPFVKEESITDWLLFEISEKIPRFYYKAFSRNEEAKETGADWEWWILFRNSSFRMRIQAKKVKINGNNYPLLSYKNRYGLQIKKLIESSNKNNFIPFYAFYTSSINKVRCKQKILNEGVYVDGAKTIYKRFILQERKKLSHNDILQYTIPLSCFLCCPIVHNVNGSGRFRGFINHYYEEEIKDVKQNNDNNDGLMLGEYKNLPKYIISFIKSVKEGLPDWWEKEFDRYIRDVNSLVVYDARDDNLLCQARS